MNLPNDPMILLSYINTQLRDFYPSLEELCHALDIDKGQLCEKMAALDYHYDKAANRFL